MLEFHRRTSFGLQAEVFFRDFGSDGGLETTATSSDRRSISITSLLNRTIRSDSAPIQKDSSVDSVRPRSLPSVSRLLIP